MQAELKQKQQDLENLDNKLQDIQTKFKLADSGRFAEKEGLINIRREIEDRNKDIGQADSLLKDKHRELELLNRSIELKTNELDGISVKLKEGRSALSSIGAEIERKQKEMTINKETEETPGGVWKDTTFKMYDEIDERLRTEDDNLKAKKLNDNKTE